MDNQQHIKITTWILVTESEKENLLFKDKDDFWWCFVDFVKTDEASVCDRILQDADLLQDVFAAVASHLAFPHELGRKVTVGLFVLAFSDDGKPTPAETKENNRI